LSDQLLVRHADRYRDLLALIFGGLLPLGLAPFDYWGIALLAPAALFWATWGASRLRLMWRFYLFNLGMFTTGVSWIYVSINTYGGASQILAAFLVALFVSSYSMVCLPQAWIYGTWFRSNLVAGGLGFIGLWVLQEWFRSWFLTGFPWLFLGYSGLETPLAGFAPVAGVFGVSLLICAISVFLVLGCMTRRIVFFLVPLVIAITGFICGMTDSTNSKKRISVSLVQGNIDQHTKWNPENRSAILSAYLDASRSEWGRDLIVWPEAAVTIFRGAASKVLTDIDQKIGSMGSSLLAGIPDRDEVGGFQNTVIALGDGSGQYIKRRLVPFGEYMPLESVLRGLIQFFDLPMSRNVPGPRQQEPILADDLKISVSICYEVVYPEIVREDVREKDLLVTVSNDTWFGSSIGPWQHLQMARMRALENGRAMVRATNNGITALIDHQGNLQATLRQFEPGVLRGDVEIRTGLTLFSRFGSLPVLFLSLLLALFGRFLPLNWLVIHGDA
tara:strand:+ start:2414 stop:3919 length:1506 start_codon:yes stop_codon:yes gene_type:complete